MAVSKVSIGKYDIKNGMQSVFLQYYPPIRDRKSMKMVQKEVLGIYIYKEPKNEQERLYNKNCMQQIEAIRALRVHSIINAKFGFLDNSGMKDDFLEYFSAVAKTKYEKWEKVYKHFENFVCGKCSFENVNVELCKRFRTYLIKDARQLSNSSKKLSNNSIASYYSTFRALLKQAFIERRLPENLNDFLEKVKWEDTKKEFLTLDEVKQLAATDCEIDVLKRASLFAIMTGLRISDILQLKWDNIAELPNGGYCIRIRTEKTNTEATLPISDEALEYCGTRSDGTVFKGLARHMVYAPLKKWLTASGIKKHITFHCFRHTFASLQVSLGTDIYTVSKMLTHKNVATTQIYADLVSEKKIESANKISIK